MKKMLYITTTQYDKYSTGIGYKIFKQIELFSKHGYDVIVYNQFTDMRIIPRLLYLMPFCNCKYNYNDIVKEENVSAIYIRYFLSDSKLIDMLKTMRKKNPSIKVLIEIPTYPYDGEINKLAPKLFKDHIYRRELSKYVDRIITYSDDSKIFGIQTINISNAVDTEKIKINHFINNDNQEVHIIGVAQFDFWHGYDRIIEGLNNYYRQGGTVKFVFHIVGYAKRQRILDDYKKMVNKYHLNENVVFHGLQYGEELDKIYAKCSLAIDSLGRHRSKVEYNSSLKGKEYLAKGLPIVSGVRTELDQVKDFPYYYRVPANDSPIDFKEIEAFYHLIYDTNKNDQVVAEIRKFCESRFTFDKAYQPLLNYLETN